jgi:hypothetical protein
MEEVLISGALGGSVYIIVARKTGGIACFVDVRRNGFGFDIVV